MRQPADKPERSIARIAVRLFARLCLENSQRVTWSRSEHVAFHPLCRGNRLISLCLLPKRTRKSPQSNRVGFDITIFGRSSCYAGGNRSILNVFSTLCGDRAHFRFCSKNSVVSSSKCRRTAPPTACDFCGYTSMTNSLSAFSRASAIWTVF